MNNSAMNISYMSFLAISPHHSHYVHWKTTSRGRTFNNVAYWGTWVAHSVKYPMSAQVRISQFVGFEPHIRLCADSSEINIKKNFFNIVAYSCKCFKFFFTVLFILERERDTETEHERGRSRVREGHRI